MHAMTVFPALLLLIVAHTASALDDAKVKVFDEKFGRCPGLCEIFSKEECPKRVERCQYFGRGYVYDDCMDEEEECATAGKKDCYANFIKCVGKYGKD